MKKADSKIPGQNPDALYLKETIQITAARDALVRAGKNPIAVMTLSCLLDMHRLTSDGSQRDAEIFIPENARQIKDDVTASLAHVAQDPTAPADMRTVSSALHELLSPPGKKK